MYIFIFIFTIYTYIQTFHTHVFEYRYTQYICIYGCALCVLPSAMASPQKHGGVWSLGRLCGGPLFSDSAEGEDG